MIRQEEQQGVPHVLSLGAFGCSIARHLRSFRPDLLETAVTDDTIALPATWPKSCVSILASWRAVPQFCEFLDDLCWKWHRPFIPLILDSMILRIGPIVIPGYGSCWGCWARRSMQHDSWQKERIALLKHYSSHPNVGPKGYLEPFALMGASRVASIVTELESSTTTAGDIWQINLLTREITTGKAVGIHDCAKCGMHLPSATRSFARMERELAYLWAIDSGEKR